MPLWLQDRRYRGERVFFLLAIPLIVGVLGILAGSFLMRERGEPEKKITEVPTPAPVTPVPAARDLGADLQAALDAGDAERARKLLDEMPWESIAARRGRAKLAMLAGDPATARREWDGVIAGTGGQPASAEDYFLRGLCLYESGEEAAAGADFGVAAERSPASSLYANRHDVYLIGAGSRHAVAEKIRLGLTMRNTSLEMAWVLPHALIALQEGNPLLADLLLERAARHFTRAELDCILDDRSFDPFRTTPSLARYFLKNPQVRTGVSGAE